MSVLYDRETVTYKGPVTGRLWQLQGKGQHKQPVTLLPSPNGLFGSSLTVHRRELPRSRRSRRVAVRPGPLSLELTVDIKGETPRETARLVRDWRMDWPDDGAPGLLAFHSGAGKWRYLDVYRTDRIEDLIGKAPQAVGKAKLMIVASADDPYPYGDYEPQRFQLTPGLDTSMSLHNTGAVVSSPSLHWDGPATTLTVTGAAKFAVKLDGESLIDLDPEELTVTDVNGTRPIVTSWDQNPACVIEPGRSVELSVKSTMQGTLSSHVTPYFEGLYS